MAEDRERADDPAPAARVSDPPVNSAIVHPFRTRYRRMLAFVAQHWTRIDAGLFVVYATLATALCAQTFVAAMLHQTGGEWSAPLDDVFIHFDYARSTARGYPFQWSEGNGYSSGNTSITYPFLLALGYWMGFRGGYLMAFAVQLAILSTVVFFLGTARFIAPAGRWAKYLVVPAVLSVGALNWSLWSGMENALHLGIWGVCAHIAARLDDRLRDNQRSVFLAWWLGAWLAVLALTRPESATTALVFGVFVFLAARKRGLVVAGHRMIAVGLPAALSLLALSLANTLLTGESSQAGAVAKLSLHHPYMDAGAKLDDWLSNLQYIVTRTTLHHFSSQKPFGLILPAVALLAFAIPKLRARVLSLWLQIILWCLVVGLNGQVRWQNERYVMSAVAWLLVLAALGIAALCQRFGETIKGRVWWGLRLAAAALTVMVFVRFQRPNHDDQVWFFARASRNIRDQHIVAGKLLKDLAPKRILVGDAGALVYYSDLPAIDIIGLGGYRDFPFARATRQGIGGALELIERMPEDDRPTVMAIYPSWWGDLPGVFGRYLVEIPVFGNVICGGSAKVLYKADWSSMDQAALPRSLQDGERVSGEVDVGDLMSERSALYARPLPHGYLVWRVLPLTSEPPRELFDAGRIMGHTQEESFEIDLPTHGGRLIARTVAVHPARVEVKLAERVLGELSIEPSSSWSETSLALPAGIPARGRLTLTVTSGEWTNYHVWSVGKQ